MKKKEIIQLGVVGVDSGQLVITDPCYIESEFKKPDSGSYDDHAHEVYRHKEDKSLWQYTNLNNPIFAGRKKKVVSTQGGINAFPGTYDVVIPQYGKSPNQLIEEGILERTEIDPTPHIPMHEFSYRGICKTSADKFGCQLNFNHGGEGVAVATKTGVGDGLYPVYAEIVDCGYMGKRVKRVWVEFLTDAEVKEMNEYGQ